MELLEAQKRLEIEGEVQAQIAAEVQRLLSMQVLTHIRVHAYV
jgi:hypothetical protein